MNFVILSLSKKILKCPATKKDISLGALIGSLLTAGIVSISIPYSFVKFILFHGPVNIVMTITGLRVRRRKQFLKAYFTVYISSFMIGGVFTSLQTNIRETGIFFIGAFISYLLAFGIWNFISGMSRCEKEECEVLLCNGESEIKVRALIDTGNRLKDSLTGKPVSIISKETALELGKGTAAKNIRYISYHTIGKKEGVMLMFPLKCMCLYLKEEERWVNQPLVAVSEESFCEGECKMILNPDVK